MIVAAVAVEEGGVVPEAGFFEHGGAEGPVAEEFSVDSGGLDPMACGGFEGSGTAVGGFEGIELLCGEAPAVGCVEFSGRGMGVPVLRAEGELGRGWSGGSCGRGAGVDERHGAAHGLAWVVGEVGEEAVDFRVARPADGGIELLAPFLQATGHVRAAEAAEGIGSEGSDAGGGAAEEGIGRLRWAGGRVGICLVGVVFR